MTSNGPFSIDCTYNAILTKDNVLHGRYWGGLACVSLISQKEGASLKKDSLEKEALIRAIVVKFKGLRLTD